MRRDYKKHRKTIILFALGIVCCFSIGYAAFSQNFLVSGKGTVVVPKETITPDKLIEKTVTTGDGLYEDTTVSDNYIYRGENPNNYITFNNDVYRIISLDKEESTNKYNLKIIKNESIGANAWDWYNTRDKSTNTYCSTSQYSGCNAWASTSNLVGTPSVFTLYEPNGNPSVDTKSYSGTLLQDSSLNTYLNGEYLEKINEDSKYIVSHNFNVGTPGNYNDTEDIATDISQESLYKWKGKIGLMNVTDVLKTTSNTTCTNIKIGYDYGSSSNCNTNNWLWNKSGYEWTISPLVTSSRDSIFSVSSGGTLGGISAGTSNNDVRPVLYLDSNIKLTGEGTETNPYTIVNS